MNNTKIEKLINQFIDKIELAYGIECDENDVEFTNKLLSKEDGMVKRQFFPEDLIIGSEKYKSYLDEEKKKTEIRVSLLIAKKTIKNKSHKELIATLEYLEKLEPLKAINNNNLNFISNYNDLVKLLVLAAKESNEDCLSVLLDIHNKKDKEKLPEDYDEHISRKLLLILTKESIKSNNIEITKMLIEKENLITNIVEHTELMNKYFNMFVEIASVKSNLDMIRLLENYTQSKNKELNIHNIFNIAAKLDLKEVLEYVILEKNYNPSNNTIIEQSSQKTINTLIEVRKYNKELSNNNNKINNSLKI